MLFIAGDLLRLAWYLLGSLLRILCHSFVACYAVKYVYLRSSRPLGNRIYAYLRSSRPLGGRFYAYLRSSRPLASRILSASPLPGGDQAVRYPSFLFAFSIFLFPFSFLLFVFSSFLSPFSLFLFPCNSQLSPCCWFTPLLRFPPLAT